MKQLERSEAPPVRVRPVMLAGSLIIGAAAIGMGLRSLLMIILDALAFSAGGAFQVGVQEVLRALVSVCLGALLARAAYRELAHGIRPRERHLLGLVALLWMVVLLTIL